MLRSKALLAVIFALAVVILCSVAASCISSTNSVDVSNRVIHLKSGTALKVRCFTPLSSSGIKPLVVVCHGMWSGKEYMDWLSLSAARSGYCVVVPDFPSDNGESNIPLLVEMLKSLISQNSSASGGIAVVGHSLGAIEALNAAYSVPQVRAIVAIGLYVGGEVNLPTPNVLIMTGMYDRFFPPFERTASIRSFTGGEVSNAGVLSGSFQDGDARKLMISPYSSHGAEVIDPFILKETVGWLDAVWSRERTASILPVWDGISHFLISQGIVVAVLCLPFVNFKGYRLSSLTRWSYPALSGFMIVMVAVHRMEGAWAALFIAAVSVAMALSPLPSQTVSDTEEAFERLLRAVEKAALFLIFLWLFFALAVLVRDVLPQRDLRLLAAAPLYLIITSLWYPLFFFDAFLRHCQDIHQIPFICVLVVFFVQSVIEAFRPGTASVPVRFLLASMQNLKLQRIKGRAPLWQYGLLVLCILLGLGLWAGVLSREKPNLSVTGAVLFDLLIDGLSYLCIPFVAAFLICRRCKFSSNRAELPSESIILSD